MKYIIILLVIILSMFYFGDHMQQQPALTYSSATDTPLASTYTKIEYCSEEIQTEVEKYKTELNAAYNKIYSLNNKLDELKSATLSADASIDEAKEKEKTESQSL